MSDWSNVKNILVIRPDNMGDLVMSGPALRSLKQGLEAHVTVLTSSMASAVAAFMSEIDAVITFDLPWVKTNNTTGPETVAALIDLLRDRHFDAAVIFTVYSQNPLPSAMIAYQAGIPKILAYCRENPYELITDWMVDQEPYAYISHQVDRDLRLVSKVCPIIPDVKLHLEADESQWPAIRKELTALGMDLNKSWLILHPGVSEVKRRFPEELWVQVGQKLTASGYQLLLTGAPGEKDLTARLQKATGKNVFDATGMFSIGQLITVIHHAPLLLSVNTGTVHLAAAVGTRVVVLYAQTNPQHTPWIVPHVVIEFPVAAKLKSRNEIVRQVDQTVYAQPAHMPNPDMIVKTVLNLIKQPAESDRPSPEIPDGSRAIAAS
jgi:ADP-heptose:LPS heptosyltransferase